MKIKKTIGIILIVVIISMAINLPISIAVTESLYEVDLTNLTYSIDGETSNIKIYNQDEFEQFVSDFNSGNLPEVYITKFLYDGVGMVKTPDLDDFIEEGNDSEIGIIGLTVININTTGNISFSGQLEKGMIAVNTNDVNGEINIILNGVSINTGTSSKDYKKAPAIYVYNKDINYTGCKVTIKTVKDTENYITGGKFKKVSLMDKDNLNTYSNYYGSNGVYEYQYEDDEGNEATRNISVSELYETYTNYYGIYTSEELNNILFAKVQADNEDLAEGDPYYFYKAAGAISSDIDLYFEGEGYLEVTSNKAEGVEAKGNLTLSGGKGDYAIYALDDCLNTTTSAGMGVQNNSVRNNLFINVNSLYAIVDLESDEGDAIDSNGTLTIEGGTIVALSKPGQDAGLDSNNGTYINGGTVVATGDMYDQISNDSKQNFIAFRLNNKPVADTLVALLDQENNLVMAYKTDRTYSCLVYSSPYLTDGTYNLYKDGNITGTEILEELESNELYIDGSYSIGTLLESSQTGDQGGMQGGEHGENNGNTPPEMPNGEFPNNNNNNNGTPPEMPNGEFPNNEVPPEIPNGEIPVIPENELSNSSTDKEGQSETGEEGSNSEEETTSNNTEEETSNNSSSEEISSEKTTESDSGDGSTSKKNSSDSSESSSTGSSTSGKSGSGTTSNETSTKSSNSSGSTTGETNTNASTSGKSSSSNSSTTDETTSNESLPYAGKINIIIPLMLVVLCLAVFNFVRYKRIKL